MATWKKILSISVPILVILGLIGWNLVQRKQYLETQAQLLERIDELTRLISEKDSTVSYYTKMVNNFDIKERDLRRQLKKINSEYEAILKEKEERILAIHDYSLTLESQTKELKGKLKSLENNVYNLEIEDFYPDPDKYFVRYRGVAQIDLNRPGRDPVIAREFTFSPVRFNLLLTETSKGAWKYNLLDAPDFIKVGDIDVNSLPPEKYLPKEERGVRFGVGGGIMKVYQGRSYLMLGAQARYRDWSVNVTGGVNGIQLEVFRLLSKD